MLDCSPGIILRLPHPSSTMLQNTRVTLAIPGFIHGLISPPALLCQSIPQCKIASAFLRQFLTLFSPILAHPAPLCHSIPVSQNHTSSRNFSELPFSYIAPLYHCISERQSYGSILEHRGAEGEVVTGQSQNCHTLTQLWWVELSV